MVVGVQVGNDLVAVVEVVGPVMMDVVHWGLGEKGVCVCVCVCVCACVCVCVCVCVRGYVGEGSIPPCSAL